MKHRKRSVLIGLGLFGLVMLVGYGVYHFRTADPNKATVGVLNQDNWSRVLYKVEIKDPSIVSSIRSIGRQSPGVQDGTVTTSNGQVLVVYESDIVQDDQILKRFQDEGMPVMMPDPGRLELLDYRMQIIAE